MHVVTRSAVILAALFAPAMAPAQAAPSADEIIARHVAAIGGKDAVLRIRSIKNVGKLDMPTAGISATMESASAPNRSFMRMTIPGIGDITSGYDGTIAWEVNPMRGPRIKTDKEKVSAQEEADFYGTMLYWNDRYQSTEAVGAADFGGEKTWQVKTVLKSGKIINEFFSVASGLKVGSSTTQESQVGIMDVVSVDSDYKQFGPIKLATRTVMTTGPQKVVVTLTDVTLDAIPAEVFALPEPVKALLIKQ